MKTSTLKVLLVLIPSVFSFLAAFLSLWTNSTSATDESVGKIVNQINDKVIPQLETLLYDQSKEISKLKDENFGLKERILKLEFLTNPSKLATEFSKMFGGLPAEIINGEKSKTTNTEKKSIHKVKS
jgi:hypothetical protein